MEIAVVDGQGGGIGRAVVERLKKELTGVRIIALGTNAVATGQMLRGGADDGATGENAIVHNMKHVDIVVGVLGILTANSMMGGFSPAMAVAIGGSHTFKVLLPLNRCHIHVVGVPERSMNEHIEEAVRVIREYLKNHAADHSGC